MPDCNTITVLLAFVCLNAIFEKPRNRVLCQQCRSPTADVMFIMDGTPSVGTLNFTLSKAFLAEFLDKFDVGFQTTRVALVQFTPMLRPEFYFNTYYDISRLKQAVSELSYVPCPNLIQCYGQQDINQSLPYGLTLAMQKATGDRPDVPDVVVILTTGQHKPSRDLIRIDPQLTGALYVFIVVVGRESQNVEFTGSGFTMQIFRIDRFDQLPGDVKEPLCRAIVGALSGLNIGGTGTNGGNQNNNGGNNNSNNGTGTGGTGNGNNNGNNNQNNNGGIGTGNNNGGTSNQNNNGSGTGGTGNGNINGGTGNQNNGNTNGNNNNGTGGTGNNGNNNNGGTGNQNNSGGINRNGNGLIENQNNNGNTNGSQTGTGNGGSNNNSSTNNNNSNNQNNQNNGNSGSGQTNLNQITTTKTNATTEIIVAGASVGGDSWIIILILLILLAVIGLLILAAVIYRKNKHINQLQTKTKVNNQRSNSTQEIIDQEEMSIDNNNRINNNNNNDTSIESNVNKNRQATLVSAPTSLHNVGLSEEIATKDKEVLIDNDQLKGGDISEDPNFIEDDHDKYGLRSESRFSLVDIDTGVHHRMRSADNLPAGSYLLNKETGSMHDVSSLLDYYGIEEGNPVWNHIKDQYVAVNPDTTSQHRMHSAHATVGVFARNHRTGSQHDIRSLQNKLLASLANDPKRNTTKANIGNGTQGTNGKMKTYTKNMDTGSEHSVNLEMGESASGEQLKRQFGRGPDDEETKNARNSKKKKLTKASSLNAKNSNENGTALNIVGGKKNNSFENDGGETESSFESNGSGKGVDNKRLINGQNGNIRDPKYNFLQDYSNAIDGGAMASKNVETRNTISEI